MVTKIGKTCATFITALFFSVQCISPVSAFNIGEERKVGEKLLYSVRSSFDLIDDPDITAYITDVGQSVVAVAGIQYFDYHFFVIDSKDFNAFAAPSGLIFFYSGLIEAMSSEDELVSVIAHEIGHIVKRHIAARLEKSKYTSMSTLGLAIAAIAFGGAAAPALLTGALATGQSLTLHFSRQNEEEADLLAYGWMKKLHRDTKGQERMLESMRRIARYRSDALPQYLLTHPNPESRLDTIQSLIEVDKSTYVPDERSRDDFDFLRFKYRVLAQATSSSSLRANLASILANDSKSVLQHDMANYGMAQIARSENNFSFARTTLNELRNKYPNKINLLADTGVLEFEAGNFEEAEKIFKDVLYSNSSDMNAIYYLGLVYQNTRRQALAIKQFEVLEKELPQYANVYYSLGKIYSNQNKIALSQFYLGKFNLYEGKIKLAHQNFRVAMRGKELDGAKREEAEKLLERIEDLRN